MSDPLSFFRRVFGVESDAQKLERDLDQLQIDWILFAKRFERAIALLELDIPLAQFSANPSPGSLVELMSSVASSNSDNSRETTKFVILAGLEQSLANGEKKATAMEPSDAYLFFSYYVSGVASGFLTKAIDRADAIPTSKWIAAYLSASAEQDHILNIEDACKLLVTRFGQTLFGSPITGEE